MTTDEKVQPFEFDPATGEFPRCTSCGAMPYFLAYVNGADLYYCVHHATKYQSRLLEASKGNVIDRRYLLARDLGAKPAPAVV